MYGYPGERDPDDASVQNPFFGGMILHPPESRHSILCYRDQSAVIGVLYLKTT